jgi:hypothetical protein
MKRILFTVTVLMLLSSLAGADTLAQEESNGQLWFCWEATVIPSAENEFIEWQVEYRSHFKEANFSYPISTWTDGLFHYYVFYPVDSYDEVNSIYAALGKVNAVWGEEHLGKLWKTVETHRTFFIRWIPEISYAPEQPRLREGATFAVWDIMYVDPARDQEFRDLAARFSVMLKMAGFEDHLNFMIGDQGYDATAYIGVLYGKSQSDLWTQNEKLWSNLGEEGAKLGRQVMTLLKKREFKNLWYVKELSYEPEE